MSPINYDDEIVKHFAALLVRLDSQKLSLDEPDEDIVRAVKGCLRLLHNENTVPFICRYRVDVVTPLNVKQMHELSEIFSKYNSLSSLRKRCIEAIGRYEFSSFKITREMMQRAKVTISRSELESLYAPFKAEVKTTLAARATIAVPGLDSEVNKLWENLEDKEASANIRRLIKTRSKIDKMTSFDALKYLLASKISSSPRINDVVLQMASTSIFVSTSKIESYARKVSIKHKSTDNSNYAEYFSLKCFLHRLRDHQVLAIQRGVKKGVLKLSLSLEHAGHIKRKIKQTIFVHGNSGVSMDIMTYIHVAIDDAFTRLISRRVAAQGWKVKLTNAETRGIRVFTENIKNALLVPPIPDPGYVLAIDPGHAAGMKLAVLDKNGDVVNCKNSLCTLRYLQNRKHSAQMLTNILSDMSIRDQNVSYKIKPVLIALGNGHGFEDCRIFLEEVSSFSKIEIEITLVDEAGASVWSVTESAMKEFPEVEPSKIGCISIGRRLINPMNEMIKMPPKSLGLGMYQHDMNEKKLEEKLRLATIDAVASVGVDINTCSFEILQNVPGLNRRIASQIIASRPYKSRQDLLKVKGLGPQTFKNCAGFVYIPNAENVLDEVRIHPESYPVSRWLLEQCQSESILDFSNFISAMNKSEKMKLISDAAAVYSLSSARVDNVLSLMMETARGVDPRIVLSSSKKSTNLNVKLYKQLPRHLISNIVYLKDECPIRNILGKVRNVTDFGIFVDFGFGLNGFLHKSKLGEEELYVGKDIGVDIVKVQVESRRITLRLANVDVVNDIFMDDDKNVNIPSSNSSIVGKKRKRKGKR